jgi:hypothetical protein
MVRIVLGLVCSIFGMSPALAAPAQTAPEPPARGARLGSSCSPEVVDALDEALELLHSFEYPEAERRFSAVATQEPSCAMAYWGRAMTLWHPLWTPPSADDLTRGAALLAEAGKLEATPREAAYVAALATFFASTDPTTHAERTRAYEGAMRRVAADHPDDPEAAVLHALAILATADPHDKSYARQQEAAGLLDGVRAFHPGHPGVLHYLIHAYDSPELASLGLDAATVYADAAPASAHAQHMPSHIFTRLGLWERAIASNRDSSASATEYTARADLHGHYDEGVHSMDYLMYALLQTARDGEAKALLERIETMGAAHPESFKVAYTLAAAPARYALERRRWQEASELPLLRADDFPWRSFGWALSIHHFARGLGAARAGELDRARLELAAIEALDGELPATTPPYWREEVEVHAGAVRAWILLAEGDEAGALAAASAAADREDGVDKHPVTPGEVLPARELYADLLLETGDFDRALAQYRVVLSHAPNRLNALLGAAAAAAGAGDARLEEEYRATAREQTREGDPPRGGGGEGRAGS